MKKLKVLIDLISIQNEYITQELSNVMNLINVNTLGTEKLKDFRKDYNVFDNKLETAWCVLNKVLRITEKSKGW